MCETERTIDAATVAFREVLSMAAYQAAGRKADWRAYLGGIRDRHSRRYKLMCMLEEFG